MPRWVLPSGRVPARDRLGGGGGGRALSVRSISTTGECVDALRMCAIASSSWHVMRATSRREEVAHTGQTMWCSRPSVVRFDAAGDVPNRSDERVVAMCRCPEWPQAVSGCR